MSLPIEQLDIKTLNRLNIPRTVESPQGLNTLFLQKVANLVYLINGLESAKHTTDERASAAVGAAGVTFTAPIDARRIVFSARIRIQTTGTVGSRAWLIRWRTKSTVMAPLLSRTVAAGQDETYLVSPATSSAANVTIQISYPLLLEPEWNIFVDDSSNIDNLDEVEWTIHYAEVPI